MVNKEKFVLVNLKEEKSKELAQIISNDTSRKILDYLSERDASESEISQKLDIPISTVHYNMQQLMKAGLVKVEELKWSEKGKEINFYKLAKKFIIIAPEEETRGLKTLLKGILPVALFGVAASGFIHLFRNSLFASRYGLEESIESTQPLALEAEARVVETLTAPNYSLWFLYGVIFAILIYLIYNLWRYKK